MSYLPDVVIYHGDCQDGFTAAWACFKYWDEATPNYIEGFYNNPDTVVEACVDRHVFMVDFSLNKEDIKRILMVCKSLIILDHHQGAQKHLQHYPKLDLAGGIAGLNKLWNETPRPMRPKILVGFDNERSGAGITWDFLFPDRVRPALINHIEDRDLWKLDLKYTKQICAWVASFEPTFANWHRVEMELQYPGNLAEIVSSGDALQRQLVTNLKAFLPLTTTIVPLFGGHENVPCANLPRQWASEGCQMLLDTYPAAPFAAAFYTSADDEYIFSLRSRADRADVSEVARQYNGNGHRNAAGFHISRTAWD